MAQSNNKQAVFSLKNVSKKREKGGNLFELNIDFFQILTGEFVAIVGASGCGKSTLLDMLGLVLKPTSADEFTVSIPQKNFKKNVMDSNEHELANIRKSHVGYVLQTGGLLPFLTVNENIHLPCLINSIDNMEKHIDDLLARLKIKEQKPKKPQFLSGGQRQRVAIARALAHRPPIVLADEPTAAVDKLTAEEIIRNFKSLTQEMGVTLLIVTHDIDLVKDECDRMFTFDVNKKNEQYTYSFCIEKDY
jgi:putative ABC transport system ATP-binding protein